MYKINNVGSLTSIKRAEAKVGVVTNDVSIHPECPATHAPIFVPEPKYKKGVSNKKVPPVEIIV